MKIRPGDLGLRAAHHLQMAAILPRPIAFVSTVGKDGVFDVAPYSSYMSVSIKPNLVGLSIACQTNGQKKRTLVNIESSREFVVNLVTDAMSKLMNQSSARYPPDTNKFKAAGFTHLKADLVQAPMVLESPINLECRALQILEFGNLPRRTSLIIGEVLLAHVKDEFWSNGEVDYLKLEAVGRLGGDSYCLTRDVFEMKRPDDELGRH